ncbi:hypothetical protein [Pseudomonas tohonis]|uniref:hypothetical protein n=1 Tax=Pseudomonas tohonis TaxID=2725477 RepID=UPI00255BC844|nr:hypothetical protein [Pseudomonas tohonis]
MSLVEFYRQKNFSSCSRIHMAPAIPPKLLSNAIEAFKFKGDPREIVALIDNTMFGSGKDGCLICSDRLLLREPFAEPTEYLFIEIKLVQSRDQRALVNGRDVLKFNMPDKRDLTACFEVLAEWLGGQAEAPGKPLAAPVEAASKATGELPAEQLAVLIGYVRECALRIESDKVFVAPNIPPKKLQAALASYGNGMTADEVIVLVDDTLFGGAKEGMLIGDTRIAMKMMMDSPRLFFWKFLTGIAVSKRKVFVNQREIAQLSQLGEAELGDFFDTINDCLQDLQGQLADQPAPAAKAVAAPVSVAAPAVEQQAQLSSEVEQSMAVPAVQALAEAQPEVVAEDAKGKDSRASEKLFGFIANAIEQNKSNIVPLLKEKTGEASLNALRDDENIERFAVFLYAFLPSVVRLALKEQVFVQFMISNRDKIIDRIIGPELQGELLEAPEPASPGSAKSLSSFARRSEPTPVRRPSLFNQKLEEGQQYLEQFQAHARSASARQRDSEEFQQGLEQFHTIQFGMGVLAGAMQVPRFVVRALGEALSGNEQAALASDETTLLGLGYAIASMSHMLREQAGFDEDQTAELLYPLLSALIVPYVQQGVDGGRKTLRSVARPMEQVAESEQMKDFQLTCRRMGMNIANGDLEDLAGNFTFAIYRAVEAQFASKEEALGLSRKLDDFARDGFDAYRQQTDEALEALLIRYMESQQG